MEDVFNRKCVEAHDSISSCVEAHAGVMTRVSISSYAAGTTLETNWTGAARSCDSQEVNM